MIKSVGALWSSARRLIAAATRGVTAVLGVTGALGVTAVIGGAAVVGSAAGSSDVATATAAAAAVREPPGFWTGPVNDPVPDTLTGGKVIHTRELSVLLKQKTPAVIVDVSNGPRRPDNLPPTTQWLPLPHQAIPGAIWIPGAGLGELPAALDSYFRQRLAQATGHDLTRRLIFYCHEKCWLSWNGARRAIQYGYRQVYWYPEGIEGWRKAQFATTVVESEPVP